MKRIISFLMALVVLVTSIGFQGAEASAASNPQIYSENMEAEAGKVISVPIYISGNQGIWVLRFIFLMIKRRLRL